MANKPIINKETAGTYFVEEESIEKKSALKERSSKANRMTRESATNRINPQLSCTISPEDKILLNNLALYACNREQKMLNTSIIIRALIRLGNKYKEELIF